MWVLVVYNIKMVLELNNIFESFDKNLIFKNKSLLQTRYQPKDIPYRDEQIKQIALVLAPVLRGERTSNLFLYGKTGTGKTLSILHVRDELLKRVKSDSEYKLKIEYLNCKLKKVSDTEYRVLSEIIKKLGGKFLLQVCLHNQYIVNLLKWLILKNNWSC